MISEFALDPTLVASWYDPKEWAFFREAFTAETGRVGSAIGSNSLRKWRGMVVKRFHEKLPKLSEQSNERRRLEALLDDITQRMFCRESSHPECPTWLEKAITEHRNRPFDGILSASPYEAMPEVITPEMLFSDNPPSSWKVHPNLVVDRTPEALTQALAPLIMRSKETIFIDPWFDPTASRFTEPLAQILKVIWDPGRFISNPTVQLVTTAGKYGSNYHLSKCHEHLPKIIPVGHCLEVTLLQARENGEKFHNRYVLTPLAGVSLGTGLDASNITKSQTDDIFRLSNEQRNKRWYQYVSGRGSEFEIMAGPHLIESLL